MKAEDAVRKRSGSQPKMTEPYESSKRQNTTINFQSARNIRAIGDANLQHRLKAANKKKSPDTDIKPDLFEKEVEHAIEKYRKNTGEKINTNLIVILGNLLSFDKVDWKKFNDILDKSGCNLSVKDARGKSLAYIIGEQPKNGLFNYFIDNLEEYTYPGILEDMFLGVLQSKQVAELESVKRLETLLEKGVNLEGKFIDKKGHERSFFEEVLDSKKHDSDKRAQWLLGQKEHPNLKELKYLLKLVTPKHIVREEIEKSCSEREKYVTRFLEECSKDTPTLPSEDEGGLGIELTDVDLSPLPTSSTISRDAILRALPFYEEIESLLDETQKKEVSEHLTRLMRYGAEKFPFSKEDFIKFTMLSRWETSKKLAVIKNLGVNLNNWLETTSNYFINPFGLISPLMKDKTSLAYTLGQTGDVDMIKTILDDIKVYVNPSEESKIDEKNNFLRSAIEAVFEISKPERARSILDTLLDYWDKFEPTISAEEKKKYLMETLERFIKQPPFNTWPDSIKKLPFVSYFVTLIGGYKSLNIPQLTKLNEVMREGLLKSIKAPVDAEKVKWHLEQLGEIQKSFLKLPPVYKPTSPSLI